MGIDPRFVVVCGKCEKLVATNSTEPCACGNDIDFREYRPDPSDTELLDWLSRGDNFYRFDWRTRQHGISLREAIRKAMGQQ